MGLLHLIPVAVINPVTRDADVGSRGPGRRHQGEDRPLSLRRSHSCVGVGEATEVRPVISYTLSTIGLHRRAIDAVLIRRRRVVQATPRTRERNIELCNARAASAVPRSQEAAPTIINHPASAADRQDSRYPGITGEDSIIRGPTESRAHWRA